MKTKFRSQLRFERLESRLALDSTVVFSELLYNPRGEEAREWLELHNLMAVDMDLSGWSLDGIDYTFPEGTKVRAGEYFVIAKSPQRLRDTHGIDAFGPYEGRLGNGGERIQLLNNSGRVMDEIRYDDQHPWPIAPDGSDGTLAKFDPDGGSSNPGNWRASDQLGGTPGAMNFPEGERLGASQPLVLMDQIWWYDTSGSAAPTHWHSPGFNAQDPNEDGLLDDQWLRGAAPLGLAGTQSPEPIQTTLPDVPTTSYFRTEFEFDGSTEATVLQMDAILDDGAVVYLNGVEVDRINMPSGPIDFDTAASQAVDVPQLRQSISISSHALEVGTNVLAVELHQAAAGSPTGGPTLPSSVMRTGAEPSFTMVWDGTDGRHFDTASPPTGSRVPRNWALASEGAAAFASSDLGPEIGVAYHRTENLNDGFYGNANSWIGGDQDRFPQSFAGVVFAEPIDVETVAWGRDNGNSATDACGGQCTDRARGTYALQYTMVPNPGIDLLETGDATSGWRSIGFATYRGNQDDLPGDGFTNFLRHEFLVRQNGAPIRASAIRILVPSTGIAAGTAIDEIEVYAAQSQTPSDAVMAASLTAYEVLATEPTLRLSEVAASDAEQFFIEIENTSDGARELNGYRLMTSAEDGFVYQFSDLVLAPRARLAVEPVGASIGEGDRVFLMANHGQNIVDGARVQNRTIARAESEPRRWLYPISPTPGEPNQFDLESDIVINELMYHAAPNVVDPAPAVFESDALIEIDAANAWRFRAEQDGLASDWAKESHEAGADGWRSGPGLIGFSSRELVHPIRSPISRPDVPVVTYYFEREFEWSPSDGTRLAIRHLIDDGAVFFINGQEVHRYNMPAGAINSATRASSSVRDAQLSELIGVLNDFLRPGSNRISVEVHQVTPSSNDLVFGVELFRQQVIVPADPGVPYTESEEEWIELYNRSDARTIDLSGWSIEDAVDLKLATGASIGPNEYRLVTNRSGAFQAKYPELVDLVIGTYEGWLSNRGEQLTLLDAHGNPADQLRYHDGGRWHEAADGFGSSLELRSPDADNRHPETWAPSVEGVRSQWQQVSYQGVVRNDGFSNGITARYHELILGMLDAGQALIDDISVIEDPEGQAIERIQNGSFETDAVGVSPQKWRIAGNHAGVVVVDPDDTNNHVLQLTATGAAEDRLNHAETTFADGARIQVGTTYEISFRAKWQSGSNQLNSHLYFDRLSRTVRLERGDRSGTPGQRNSTWQANLGPTFNDLHHHPTVPRPNEPIEIEVQIADPDSVESAYLWYSVDSQDFQSITMSRQDHQVYRGLIPGQSAGQVIQFYVQAFDELGTDAFYPQAGPDSRALIVVDDGQTRAGIHNLRVIMTPQDAAFLHERTNVTSNGRLGSTVVVNNQKVYYDTGVRLKGSNAGRGNDSYLSFNVAFDPMQLFRGVHATIAIDRSGRSGSVPMAQDEILIKHIGNHAGEIPYMYDDLVHFIAPLRRHTRTALLMMARYGDVFLDSQFQDGSDGTVFKLDIAYVPDSTTNRLDRETPKVPFPYSHPQPARDFEFYGADKEQYRSHLLIRNNRRRDDYQAIIEAARAIGSNDGENMDAIKQLLDVDQWARVFALQSLTGVADTYTRGVLHHNISFYVRPRDDRVLALPWDWDFAFTASPNQPLIGTSGTGGRLMSTPSVRRIVHGHLLDLIETTFNNDYLDPWIDHYGEVAGQNYAPIKRYVSQRRSFVERRLPSSIPFAIDELPGEASRFNQPIVTLTGQGWIDVFEVRDTNSGDVINLAWQDDTTWTARLLLDDGRHDVSFSAFDRRGNLVGESSITVDVQIGDLDGDQVVDINDVHVSAAIHVRDMFGPDLNADGRADSDDYWHLVREVIGLPVGDANLDGRFDSSDLVQVFQFGEYEDDVTLNSTWTEGDWNGDGDFTTRDLVVAFQFG